MSFQELELIEPLLRALQKEGYTQPTPIQQQAIPVLLKRKDLLACAQTGTGKTAAFTLPILQLLHSDELYQKGPAGIKALILTPTRELALQIGESLTAYGAYLRLRHTVIFGGVGQKPQTDALRTGVDVLVATPGRLLDLMAQRHVRLDHVKFFVLDEADRMLDMGFIHDVRKVIAKLPVRRQTLLFSATMPAEIARLSEAILHQPVTVQVTPVSSTVEAIEQSVYFVEKTQKRHLLKHLLDAKAIATALVFTRTKHGADRVARGLNQAGIRAEAIHGNKSQNQRQQALANFKARKTRVLVATDIAARGIDIDELSHVINFELPNVPETYVHRIGRTGRAGAAGVSISFCDTEERAYLHDIQKVIKKALPVAALPPLASDNGNGGTAAKPQKNHAHAPAQANRRGHSKPPRRQHSPGQPPRRNAGRPARTDSPAWGSERWDND